MSYIPKGGMCSTCKSMNNDCRSLLFESMPVIKAYKDGTLVVKCTSWERKLPPETLKQDIST